VHDGARQGACLVGIHESQPLGAPKFAEPAAGGGDDWQPAGQRLAHHQGHALAPPIGECATRVNEEISGSHPFGQGVLSEDPGKLQSHACGVRKSRQARLLGTLTRNHQLRPRRRRDCAKSRHKNIEALDGHEPSGGKHRGRAQAEREP